ncbi:MAG: hypothetical protein V4724_03280 [Pseudomonadota bacterium]
MLTRMAQQIQAQPAAPAPAATGALKPVAIFVCHGMGEQVPFESIDAVAAILRKHIEDVTGPAAAPPGVDTRIVELGSERLARAELQVPVGTGLRSVHVYETYWAPLTAGKVGILDVFSFLMDAGISGCDKSWKKFNRYLFGAPREFPATPALLPAFILLMAMLAALALMSGTAVAVGTARMLTQSAGEWPSAQLMTDLTCDFLAYGSFAAVLAALYWLALRRVGLRKKTAQEAAEHWLNLLIAAWLGLTVLATLATGAAVLYHLYRHQGGHTAAGWNVSPFPALAVTLIWAVILYINGVARRFLVDYLGDVLAYIAPHTANKFAELRAAIQQRALGAARAIYAQPGADGEPLYERIIVAGHSLGSVIAYDTLNAILLDDEMGCGRQARERTSHLITFGSPLDKTAFIFREQQSDSYVREALAANMQPLILDFAQRGGLKWVNLWSRHDPISGRLQFYNLPPREHRRGERRVINWRDRASNIPLLAHIMYWQSPLLRRALADAVAGR